MNSPLVYLRISASFFTIFLGFGIFLPFLPLWLTGRGLTADQIGLVLAAALWCKIPVGLGMMQVADQTGQRKKYLILFSLLSLSGIIGFIWLDGFWQHLIGWAFVGTLLTTMVPLTDSLSVIAVNRHGVDYGRIRLWGSISFILASTLGGYYLQGKDTETVITLLIIATLLMFVGTICLPNLTEPARSNRNFAIGELLRSPRIVGFFLTVSIMQASHAGLYGFATLSWQKAGIGNDVIGLLWAIGVIFEILLFMFSSRLISRLGISGMLMVAGLAGMIRWLTLGTTTWVPALFVVQAMHALTFGCCHVAAITYISRKIPSSLSASAQGLYDGLAMGFLFGIFMLIAGQVYAHAGDGVFYVMAALSSVGLLGAIMLKNKQIA